MSASTNTEKTTTTQLLTSAGNSDGSDLSGKGDVEGQLSDSSAPASGDIAPRKIHGFVVCFLHPKSIFATKLFLSTNFALLVVFGSFSHSI